MGTVNRRQFLAGSAALAAASCNGCSARLLKRPLPERPNFIVFLSDTLRADHLSCYGYRRPTTPHIDALAAASLLFERCYANATWTLPSTASILTGVHPLVHRTVVPEWSAEGEARGFQHQVLPPSLPTMAATLQAHGYATAWFQANPNATADRGLARGFQHHDFELNASPAEHVDAAIDWLENEAREPFFAYIHLIDPHEPYTADPALYARLYRQKMEDALAVLPVGERERLRGYHERNWYDLFIAEDRLATEDLRTFSKPAVDYFKGLYDSEICRVDQAFGRLHDWLTDRGPGIRTVTVLTSDHGEAFGEDNWFYHGSCLHDPQLHVPFIISVPGLREGRRVPWTMSLCDIHPTLLTLAGIPGQQPASSNMLLRRSGELVHTSHRGVLSCLDNQQSDPAQWGFRLTHGQYRVFGSETFGMVRVESEEDEAPTTLVGLAELESLPESPLRTAVAEFYRQRQNFSRKATRWDPPAWKQAQRVDPEVFRAMGYLE